MRQMLINCPTHGGRVAIVVTDDAGHDTQAPVHDPELVCLDVDGSCAGQPCPLCGMSVEAMDARLARSGLELAGRRAVSGKCDACDRVTELLLTVGGRFTCTECGTTSGFRALL